MLDIHNENIDWKRDSDVTIEDVKTTEGFTHLADEQASEVVVFIKTYCNLMYNLYKKQVEEEQQQNGKIIPLDINEPIKEAA